MSSVNTNYSTGYTPTIVDSSTTTQASKTLNQQDFLKLLVAQLSSQDPMNPQSNSDFAAQMAQFSALQSSQGTQAELAQLRSDAQILQANNLLGRTVTLQGKNHTTLSGTVGSVQMNAGSPQLMVNGVAYDLSQILSIQPTLTPQP